MIDIKHAEILHNLGLACAQASQLSESIDYFKQAIELAPHIPAFHNNLGNAYKRTKQFNLAQIHYFEALRLKSPYPEVHNNLGGLYYQQGQIQEAILQFEKSLHIQPQQTHTRKNLANSYMQQNRLTEAILHFKKILESTPDDLTIIHNLGMALSILKQYKEAYPFLKQVLQQDPNSIEILYQLAVIEFSFGHLDEAKKLYLKLLALKKDHNYAIHNLATIYLRQNNKEKALDYYRQALELNPSNLTAQHMINALSGIAHKEGAPVGYVNDLFNQYAYTYNQHMLEQLHYQVPLLLREVITAFAFKLANTLDLGCGTGLCAPYFRDITDKLTGVDISKNMIMLASQQGGYDELIETDILSYFKENVCLNHFDLIIAADTFVYFADLSVIFSHCYQALKSSGFLIFSVEVIHDKYPIDYELQTSGRYRHHPNYIHNIAIDLGFYVQSQKKAILRQENESPVWGMIFLIRPRK